ncbi:adenylate/guanylate cyclase domain-containing protein [Pseudovibrio sp. Tun.PSC04-5.I4]|uniref:adenylate/guanylate cyclase domain-containing protein n=1 Tax=Pseudovibrio sp. Tun.PSC04-5.I4 TaxID=1798213 RepID=UPI00088E51AB|nr:adenylate/guanylate cyclase domain-containing protein [Pseudovibrio sp. Tun.PSC04-5.I4]SDR39204.1 adenylate cyclase [Pseudovibrio sp. Tun.PSC04-5.I4]
MSYVEALSTDEIAGWLSNDAKMLGRPCRIFAALGERLIALGIRVDRISSGVSILDPNFQGEGIIWENGVGPRLRYFQHMPELDESYNQSLWKRTNESRMMIRHKFGHHDEYDQLMVIQELKEQGYTDYVAIPMLFSDGGAHGLAFASRDPDGFKDKDVRLFNEISRPLSLVFELFSSQKTSENILNTYLGARAGHRVLNGEIKRGDGERINAIVAFCDIRNFTGFSNYLSDRSLFTLLNEYFGIVTSRVEQHGGEILKFIGDEVLAVFPYTDGQSARIAAFEAMNALRESLTDLAQANVRGFPNLPAIHVGMGVHAGRVFFGNVGGERRLDFTVIGPVVNEAARIATLSKRLNREMLISQSVAEILTCCDEHYIGTYPLKGFQKPVKVYQAPELTRSCLFGPGNTAFLACEKN